MDTIRQIIEAIKQASAPRTSSYDTPAEVVRVEDGIAWVHIPGGVTETPVKLTIDAKAGDTVQVRVGGGRAWLTGNASAPPTDDTKAKQVAESVGLVSKAVHIVEDIANRAARLAGDTAQYFWVTETGSDTGAHITEVPQEEFLADPEHAGGNLLARSNGVAVRKGLRELAIFSADGLQVFSDTATPVEIAHIGYGETAGRDGFDEPAPYYTFGTRAQGAIGAYSLVAGEDCTASAYDAMAMGDECVASGGNAIAMGGMSQAIGDYAVAIGADCVASGDYSTALGNAEATAEGAVAIGSGVVAASENQTVVGTNNVVDQNDEYAFIVGNGDPADPTDRSNAFAVTRDGDIVLGRSPITTVTGSTATAVNNTPITVARITLAKGNYLLIGCAHIQSNTVGSRAIRFSRTDAGDAVDDFAALRMNGIAGGVRTLLLHTWAHEVTADSETLYLVVNQSSGSDLTVYHPGIRAVRVG